jgi:hypothetical protein
MSTQPWMETPDDLPTTPEARALFLNRELTLDGRGRVLVTRPDVAGPHNDFSIGAAVDAALTGATASFTMIVAYFAHGYSAGNRFDFDHPERVILRELGDAADLEAGRPRIETRFRLLFGELRSPLSRQSLMRWWLLCRWRVKAPVAADKWRQSVVAEMRAVVAADRDPAGELKALAARLVAPTDALCPFVGEKAGPLSDDISAAGPDLLLLFMIQRAADVRCGRGGDSGARIFHPKLYVVERKTDAKLGVAAPDTVVIGGSANWSGAALSATGEANVEVATIHRVSGHVYRLPPSEASLGSDLASTARMLFETAHPIAVWEKPYAVDDPTPFFEVDLSRCVDTTSEPPHSDPATPPPRPPPDDLARLAHAIRTDIELAVGIDPKMFDDFRGSVARLGPKVWGGKKPSVYQIDGALRLLTLLRTNRGAMLSDEPGLGKTLIAQIVVANLIRERIRERWALAAAGNGKPAPIRVSILAPARVLGQGRGAAGGTQWHAYASEIRDAAKALLALTPDETGAASWTDEEHLIIRPMTNQSLSRQAFQADAEPLRHLSESEIVVLDEAHNFRNGGGTGTRALRFCLAMPVPGEHGWRTMPSVNPGQEKQPLPEAQDGEARSALGRKILLLTATPFNNRIEDVRTQLGHFAKAMDWPAAISTGEMYGPYMRRVYQRRAATDPYWQAGEPSESQPGRDKNAKPTENRSSTDFQTLLSFAEKHFESTRALDDDDAKEDAKAAKGKSPTRPAPSDGGPRYVWAGQHRELGAVFATISRALADRANEESTATQAEQNEWRSRVDAMLVDHVVQRSRRQVLRMVEANDPEEPPRMFRAPEQRRLPIPIQTPKSDEGDRDTFEAEVLGKLFELVVATGSPGETESATNSSRLTMMAYTLRYERGLSSRGGADTDSRGATNFIGFQAIGLVKRLQSSPYAFVMTLVRGLLRTCFYELVLMDEMLRRLGVASGTKSKKGAAQLAFDTGATLSTTVLAAVDKRLGDIDDDLRSDVYLGSDNGKTLLRLLGITRDRWAQATDRRGRLWLLADLEDPDLADESKELTRVQKERRRRLRGSGTNAGDGGEAERGAELLTHGAVAKRPRRGGKDAESADGPMETWASRLVADLAQPHPKSSGKPWRSGVVGDLFLALEWLVENLIPHVFSGATFDAEAVSASPMDALAERFRGGGGTDWVKYRLEQDARAADLLAWLLAQTIVRRALDEGMPAERSTDLPAGVKSLVFSEYADTLAYLRTVVIAVHACIAAKGTQVKARLAIFRNLSDRILSLVTTFSDHLASSGAESLPPPLSANVLERLLKPGKPNEEVLRPAIEALFAATALLTSRSPRGQRFAAAESDAGASDDWGEIDEDTDIESSLGADADRVTPGTVESSSALDAFSPWYQIDPKETGAGGAGGPWQRLRAAHEAPVHVLMATEVLSEGVNLQECGVVVHYDLPWNPTRLIQRNGRVDRRIDVSVEEEKERLSRALFIAPSGLESAAKDMAAAYWPPRHVYHLTVPPIEPSLEQDALKAYARKVREILFKKLSGIREIFGLAAWPVVLDQEQAKEVLDGGLAYETPAFRRREELFVAHETMSRLARTVDPTTVASANSMLVVVKPDVLEHIHRTLSGIDVETPGDVPEHAPATSNLAAVGVMAWSRWFPKRLPVRSQVDLRALCSEGQAQAETENFKARHGIQPDAMGMLAAIAWVAPPGAAESALLAWRESVVGGTRLVQPALVDASSFGLEWRDGSFAWETLNTASNGPAGGNANGVAAPTSAFEAVLVGLSQFIERDPTQVLTALSVDDADTPDAFVLARPWHVRADQWWLLSGRSIDDDQLAYGATPGEVDAETSGIPLGTNLFVTTTR